MSVEINRGPLRTVRLENIPPGEFFIDEDGELALKTSFDTCFYFDGHLAGTGLRRDLDIPVTPVDAVITLKSC